jgi:aspartyl-tRNA(Asn)/glutamyl-tRNA(Gln) amidotransferase subunit A
MMVTDISIAEASDLLRRKQISPVELTTSCLARVEQLNPTINAFITVMHDSALAQAREAEAEIRAGKWRGPLHGIPIGLKDLIDTAGVKTTCGSDLFKDRVPIEDAEIVRRLKDAGAVLIGKQNMQEFAYGGTSTSSHFGPIHNPCRSHSRRFFGWFGCGCSYRHVLRRDRDRHWRLRPRACGILRNRRSKTNVWSREHARGVSPLAVAGPRRTTLSQRRRYCAVASSYCRL